MFASLPLTALRAFESASRLLSFKAAAEELSVTPTAVSHQIRSLESWLGVALFERLPRQVRLTEGGERLFHSLHGALLEVAQSVDTLRPHRSRTNLTISTTAAFAALWLVPRLGRFYARHPNISVRLDTHCEVIDLHQDASVDLVVRYSLDDYPNLYGLCLFDESFGVYGSPEQVALAARHRPTLISVHWHNSKLYAHGWEAWCAQSGEAWLEGQPTVREYDEEHYALQAAIAGQGLVLASNILVSESVASGLLMAYRGELQVDGAGYSALCVPGRERHPPVRAFFTWLQEEAKSSGLMPGSQPQAAITGTKELSHLDNAISGDIKH
ncbi:MULTISPECIES: LysR substrate-binding domain-containing protein [Pseudomonas]|jgi:DNA-binding transcriptional LysR family regulator|uniref:LysR substrate-binding domain-containing protein n=1 Tax=Pseudomonas TaxID=286 RepID=UPI00062B1D64|nr:MULTISPECIES: LysR substrate-binding domain-containing protein [Pseudomonas]MCK8656091.1 LysR substrate-binding domain-containing protein [Pseudomonas umsongensis]NBB59618.1 LysR family transcriptional regulator [Pseudomonas sp. ODNR1LW]OMQ33667.1 LysR family transcriptional regulator [Pseudomonas putida]